MTTVAASVDRELIERLVDRFYADVRVDPLLGPIFKRFVRRSWPDHLVLMTDFWCATLKIERGFRGNVYGRHMALAGVTPAHLLRWLQLWRHHTSTVLPPDVARRLQAVAVGIARVMHLGWFGSLPTRQLLERQLDAFSGALADSPASPN